MDEEIKESYLDSNISFLPYGIKNIPELSKTRREYIKITDMLWLNKRAVIASWGEALIMIFLN